MKISNETKVGILATVAITVLILGYSFLKGTDLFMRESEFYAVYPNIDGLTESKPVLVNGFKIGRVSNLRLAPNGHIIAQFQISPDYKIPKNTTARLESTDLLGGKAIVFELGNSKDFAADGDTLTAFIQEGFMDQVKPIQKKADQIAGRLDSILESVNNTLNPKFQKNFDRSFASIANTLENLERTSKKVDGLMDSETAKISGILSNLQSISTNFKNNNQKISTIVANFEQISDQTAKANIGQTLINANQAVKDLQQVISKINAGEGSIGLLINDKKLYDNLAQSAENLDKLMVDLKANPKRYVHFSVFGGGKK
ncbi:MAG: MlaD family protein [Sphingobacteriaceae bacterium]|nr:MlaD family protein [Sphingobacteriaceae bacterium]